ncbi:MAG: hypothetical protein WCF67_11065 [Chitinophagaceae bacterium]
MAFNPFSPLTTDLLDAFIKSGKRYFVRQTFRRGRDHFNTDVKEYFLICHYTDIGYALAHFNGIEEDAYRFLYNWDDKEHRSKLEIAAQNPPGFRIYANVFEKNWQRHITNPIKYKIRRYIENSLQWRPSTGETVDFQLYSHFGETFARITHNNKEVRLKLADIESIA